MRGRHAVLAAGAAFVMLGVACVDLFHGTDFDTLCTRSPSDPQCGDAAASPDAASDGATADAQRPRTDFCKWDSATARAQALRACAWLGACEGPFRGSAFGPCVIRAQLAYDCAANPALRPAGDVDDLWSCLTNVATCGDVDQCVFPGGVQACITVSQGVLTACGGGGNRGVLFRCASQDGGRATGIEPCAMGGQTCAKESESAASCAGTLGHDACTTSTCVGSAAVDCAQAGTRTFDRGIDCARSGGGRCVIGDGGMPQCTAGAGAPPCLTDAPPRCVPSSMTGASKGIVSACVEGREITVNCTTLGLPCDEATPVPSYDPAAACVERAPAPDCVEDACLGARLSSCGRGVVQTVDCVSVGLKNCKLTNGKAACTPP